MNYGRSPTTRFFIVDKVDDETDDRFVEKRNDLTRRMKERFITLWGSLLAFSPKGLPERSCFKDWGQVQKWG